MITQIKSHYFINKGVDWFHYLHIHGGTGERGNNGGQYGFCVFYITPEDAFKIDKCPRFWCIENKILFGIGDTIEDAYRDYLKKLGDDHPLKQQ